MIDSGVNPDVSDLTGSVITGPDYTGVTTKPSSPDWGVHGTWMASLIAGHGHDGGDSGVIGIAPQARILSIRVIPDRTDPHYGKYEREPEATHPAVAGRRDRLRGAARREGDQHVDRLRRAERRGPEGAAVRPTSRGVVVVASAGNSGQPADGDRRPGAGVLPRRLPRRDQRRRGRRQRRGGQLLQRQPVRPGRRAGRVGARAGPGRGLLVGQRHQPGLRAGRRGRRPDQGPVPVAGARPGGQRADHHDHRPSGRGLRQPGGVRHRRRGRGPGQGRAAGRRPARGRRQSPPRPGSAAARPRCRSHRCTPADRAS